MNFYFLPLLYIIIVLTYFNNISYKDINIHQIKTILKEKYKLEIIKKNPLTIKEL